MFTLEAHLELNSAIRRRVCLGTVKPTLAQAPVRRHMHMHNVIRKYSKVYNAEQQMNALGKLQVKTKN